MASPNYSGEKRRKDLAKQAKKKEKLARKADKPAATAADYLGLPPEPEAPAEQP